MSATRVKRTENESEPETPQTTPQWLGTGMPSHDFTLQAVMDLSRSVAGISSDLKSMKDSIDGLRSKVEDLVGWKNKIFGGVAVLVAVFSIAGYLVGKASDYVTIKMPVTSIPNANVLPSPAIEPSPVLAAPAPLSASQAARPPK